MKYNLPSIYQIGSALFNDDEAFLLLISTGIIKASIICSNCGNISNLKKERRKYRCNKFDCRKEKSCFYGSFFYKSKLSCSQILMIGYFWLAKSSHTQIMTYSGLSEHTVTEYIKYFRELVSDSLNEADYIIGGNDVVVQIDETKLGKRKYHRGHRVEGVWILGGVELSNQRKLFLRIVESRDRETMEDIIQRHVLPGSIIMTDCFKSYNRLNSLGYRHMSVNHSYSFVDRNTSACTNSIEGTWNALKMQIPPRNRTIYCETNLWEFIWRRMNENDLWNGFLLSLKEIFYDYSLCSFCWKKKKLHNFYKISNFTELLKE